MIEGRYIVELEKNHHYLLIDTLTGRSFYTPAQDDAKSIAGLLNSNDSRIREQYDKIEMLENILKKNNISFDSNHSCSNCEYKTLRLSGAWCELNEKPVALYDSCKSWKYGL